MGKTKEYTNGEVTVVWQPEKCVHSAICAKGLPDVFRPRVRPWVRVNAASTAEIVKQVKQCPSNALSYYMNQSTKTEDVKVEILENGPILVHGSLEISHRDGVKEQKKNVTAFCRCGHSSNKPYCDGTHIKEGFLG